ncbi:MAG: hypothetical protein KBF71_04190 [Alphaproteobacteria bacterium]|nr:hypothetical protein [Alphaproteobacteria bacterium]
MTCTTLYLSNQTLSYEFLHWDQSVSLSMIKNVDAQESSILRVGSTPWVHILPFLGEQAINMRKVCAFFLFPCFENIYKASPLTPQNIEYRNSLLDMILRADRLLTNSALFFKPFRYVSGEVQPEALTSEHWKSINEKMPQCRSIGPVIVKELVGVLQEEAFPLLFPKISSLMLIGAAALNCNVSCFQNLYYLKLSMYMFPEAFLKGLSGTLPALRVFKCCINTQLNLEIFSHLCRMMPHLERLHLASYNRNDEGVVGVLELPAHAMRSVLNLSIAAFSLCAQDILTILEAAPSLQQLKLKNCDKLREFNKILPSDSLVSLRKLIVRDSRFDWTVLRGFLQAAPQLAHLSHKQTPSSILSFAKLPKMPNMRRFDFKGGFSTERVYKRGGFVENYFPVSIHDFIPWFFEMPQLEEVRIEMVNLTYDSNRYFWIEKPFLQNVRALHLQDLKMNDLMLMRFFRNAVKLQKLYLENIKFDGRDEWIVSNLEEDALGELTNLSLLHVDIHPICLGALLSHAKKLERLTIKSSLVKNPCGEIFTEAFDLPHLTYCRLDGYKNLDATAWVVLLKAAPNIEQLYINQGLIYPVLQKLHDTKLVLKNLRALYYSSDPNNKGDNILLPAYISEIAPQFEVLDVVSRATS